MPEFSAKATAALCGLLLATHTTLAPPSWPASCAASSARKLLPRPEASTTMRNPATLFSSADEAHALAAVALHDVADFAVRKAQLPERSGDRGHFARRQHHHEAHAAVEGAPHFLARHRALALQPVEHRRQHDRGSFDVEAEPFRDHADDVLG